MARFCYTAFAALCGSCIALPVLAQQDQSAAARADFPRFDTVDANLDDTISRQEFSGAFAHVEAPDELFAAADADGDGRVTRQEWGEWREQRLGATDEAADEAALMEEERFEHPSQIELEFTNETVQGRYFTDAGLVRLDGNQLGFGLLFSEDRDFIGDAQVMAPGLMDDFVPDFVELSFGGRAFVALLGDPSEEVAGFAPGATARVALPFLEDVPLAAVGHVFFAPDILSFGEAEEVVDFGGRLEARFLERTTGFVGIRVLNFEREGGGDDTIIDGLTGGVRFTF